MIRDYQASQLLPSTIDQLMATNNKLIGRYLVSPSPKPVTCKLYHRTFHHHTG